MKGPKKWSNIVSDRARAGHQQCKFVNFSKIEGGEIGIGERAAREGKRRDLVDIHVLRHRDLREGLMLCSDRGRPMPTPGTTWSTPSVFASANHKVNPGALILPPSLAL